LDNSWAGAVTPDYTLVDQTGEMTLVLPPHSALKVLDGGRGGYNPASPEWFELQMLSIRRGDSVLVELQGIDVLPAFAKTKETLYVLRVDTIGRGAR
jgi:hypothetical protein